MKLVSFSTVLVLTAASGCSAGFAMRSADRYRDDTRQVLAERDQQIQSCYNVALNRDPLVSGDVTVKFEVQSETGRFENPTLVEEETTAPTVLQQCVLNALQNLSLKPADEQQGIATFTWSFRAQKS